MNPSCIVPTVQAAGDSVMIEVCFSWSVTSAVYQKDFFSFHGDMGIQYSQTQIVKGKVVLGR